MAFTSLHLFFDDLEIGQSWESAGRTITQADIVNFAGLSGDFNPIHMDHEFARTTPFRQVIAHGLLVFSIGSGLGVSAPLVRTLAVQEVRQWHFRAPVFIGDTIRVRSTVVDREVRSRGRRAVISWHRQILNQENKVVQEGLSLTLVEGKANLARAEDSGRQTQAAEQGQQEQSSA